MESEAIAVYDKDSRRYHRFLIDQGQGITGTIYVLKGKEIPDSVTIRFKTKGDDRSEKEVKKF